MSPTKEVLTKCDNCPDRWRCWLACDEVSQMLDRMDYEMSAAGRKG